MTTQTTQHAASDDVSGQAAPPCRRHDTKHRKITDAGVHLSIEYQCSKCGVTVRQTWKPKPRRCTRPRPAPVLHGAPRLDCGCAGCADYWATAVHLGGHVVAHAAAAIPFARARLIRRRSLLTRTVRIAGHIKPVRDELGLDTLDAYLAVGLAGPAAEHHLPGRPDPRAGRQDEQALRWHLRRRHDRARIEQHTRELITAHRHAIQLTAQELFLHGEIDYPTARRLA